MNQLRKRGKIQTYWTGETYSPDFYIVAEDRFIEVKGHLSDENYNKMVAFHEQYPAVRVEFLDKPELEKIGVLRKRGRDRVVVDRESLYRYCVEHGYAPSIDCQD